LFRTVGPDPRFIRILHLFYNLRINAHSQAKSNPCSKQIMATHGANHSPILFDGDIEHTLLIHRPVDGLAPAPYIRESRHILGEFTVLEQHIVYPLRPHGPEIFKDSVGIGCYRIDLARQNHAVLLGLAPLSVQRLHRVNICTAGPKSVKLPKPTTPRSPSSMFKP
jgi:hypothetical protein